MAINLLPWREQIVYQQKINFLTGLISAILIISFLDFGYYIFLSKKINYQLLEIKKLKSEYNLLEDINKKNSDLIGKSKPENEKMYDLYNLQNSQNNFVKFLQTVPSVIPINVKLNDLTFSNNNILLMGEAHSLQLVMEFVKKIERLYVTRLISIHNKDKLSNKVDFKLEVNV